MKGIMIQGTCSDAGKSFIVTGLCRMLSDMGVRVCPFKSQNMSNNSCVTHDGCEVSRAQAVQAEAARLRPETFMNPILLKPRGDTCSEIVLNGRVTDTPGGGNYYREFTQTRGIEAVRAALKHIEANFDAVIIEGAGSPAEVNLNSTEIVNMRIAREADVPVILTTDVDRGGSLASIVGTLELVGTDRSRVKGIIFNKFRGDLGLFEPAVRWTEGYTGVSVIGVMPYVSGAAIAGEDSLSVRWSSVPSGEGLNIGVVRFPGLSNYTDLDPFGFEPDVSLVGIDADTSENVISRLDAVILPGSKNTMRDMNWLTETGLADDVKALHRAGRPVFGLCGGYQMAGSRLLDPELRENTVFTELDGLGLLPVTTDFRAAEKRTECVSGTLSPYFCCRLLSKSVPVEGYEIHFGRTYMNGDHDGFAPLFSIGGGCEGAASADMSAAGTYLHGVFDNDEFRAMWLNAVRRSRGMECRDAVDTRAMKEAAYDTLADAVRKYLRTDEILKLIRNSEFGIRN